MQQSTNAFKIDKKLLVGIIIYGGCLLSGWLSMRAVGALGISGFWLGVGLLVVGFFLGMFLVFRACFTSSWKLSLKVTVAVLTSLLNGGLIFALYASGVSRIMSIT